MQRCPQAQRESVASDTLTVTHESPARESLDKISTFHERFARPQLEAEEAAAIAAGTRPRVRRLRMHRSLGAWGNAFAKAQARRRSSPSAIHCFIADPRAERGNAHEGFPDMLLHQSCCTAAASACCFRISAARCTAPLQHTYEV